MFIDMCQKCFTKAFIGTFSKTPHKWASIYPLICRFRKKGSLCGGEWYRHSSCVINLDMAWPTGIVKDKYTSFVGARRFGLSVFEYNYILLQPNSLKSYNTMTYKVPFASFCLWLMQSKLS